jgi:hypothetical protein
MREEHVNLNNIGVPDLYDAIKTHLQQDLKLDIIHEEKFDNYWSIKAYRGGKVNTITGSVRDIEVIISGTENNFDLVLRAGAWGRDVFVPGAIAGIAAGGIGAGVVAGLEVFRAYSFESEFWKWLNQTVQEIGEGRADVSKPRGIDPSERTKNKILNGLHIRKSRLNDIS